MHFVHGTLKVATTTFDDKPERLCDMRVPRDNSTYKKGTIITVRPITRVQRYRIQSKESEASTSQGLGGWGEVGWGVGGK